MSTEEKSSNALTLEACATCGAEACISVKYEHKFAYNGIDVEVIVSARVACTGCSNSAAYVSRTRLIENSVSLIRCGKEHILCWNTDQQDIKDKGASNV